MALVPARLERGGREVTRDRRLETRTSDEGEADGGDGSVLTAEGQRAAASLLLAHSADLVVQCVIDGDLSVDLHDEAASLREEGVANVVLGATAGGSAEVARPPVATTWATGWGGGEHLIVGQGIGELVAEVIDRILQAMVEEVSHHRHPTAHPLSAAQLGTIELSHRAAPLIDRGQHADCGVEAEVVTTGDVVDDIFSGRGELLHNMLGVGPGNDCTILKAERTPYMSGAG